MDDVEQRSLAQRWRSMADGLADTPAAAVYRRCAADLEKIIQAPNEHPRGYVRVAVIHGITERVDILMSEHGHYGLEVYSETPGHDRTVAFPDGRLEIAPTAIYTPDMCWQEALSRAARLAGRTDPPPTKPR
jgi:hypothetical protein